MPQYKTTDQVKKEQGFLGVCELDATPHRFNQFMHGPRGYGACKNWKLTSIIAHPSEKEQTNVGMETNTEQPIPKTGTET